MKSSAKNVLRALAPPSRSARLSIQPFSSSTCCRDAHSEAESSSASSNRSRGKLEAYPGESAEDAFKRNLKEVQTYRRRREAMRVKSPFIPPTATPEPQLQPSPLTTALSTLVATGAALGCSTSKLDKSFSPYVYGNRAGLSIIDLDQTLPILRRTAALVRDVVKADGVVLFVGTRPGHKKALDKAKDRLGDNGFSTHKWMPGLLTNAETLFGLQSLLEKSNLPDLVVFLNPADNSHAIRECTARNIPTVGIIDSNTDPRLVTYPIPANVESLRTAELIIGTLSIAGQEGRRLRLKEVESRQKRNNQRRQHEIGEQRVGHTGRSQR